MPGGTREWHSLGGSFTTVFWAACADLRGWWCGRNKGRAHGRPRGGMMNPKTSTLATLLGSASLLAITAGNAQAQQVAQAQTAQATPAEVPEQVLVTGSLIRGAAAVGVPV